MAAVTSHNEAAEPHSQSKQEKEAEPGLPKTGEPADLGHHNDHYGTECRLWTNTALPMSHCTKAVTLLSKKKEEEKNS